MTDLTTSPQSYVPTRPHNTHHHSCIFCYMVSLGLLDHVVPNGAQVLVGCFRAIHGLCTQRPLPGEEAQASFLSQYPLHFQVES